MTETLDLISGLILLVCCLIFFLKAIYEKFITKNDTDALWFLCFAILMRVCLIAIGGD